MQINRRQFAAMGATSLGVALTPSLLTKSAAAAAASESYYFAILADPHIIDHFYVKGSENGVEDNTTILQTIDHLTFARSVINGIQLPGKKKVEQTFVVGDVFHNYPSTDYDFYFKNHTRIDNAVELLNGFSMPVHIGYGNHDYDGRPDGVSREMSHRLFEAKFKKKPYYAVDYKGFRFLHLNNFLGSTWAAGSDSRLKQTGTLGEEQLNWAEAQLAERKPTVVFIHYPLWIVAPTEVKDYGAHPLLRKYKDNISVVVSGHWHKWIDFGHTYGPQHTVAGSTRYDQNAFMLMEADPKQGTVRWVDSARPEWSTHYTAPYRLG